MIYLGYRDCIQPAEEIVQATKKAPRTTNIKEVLGMYARYIPKIFDILAPIGSTAWKISIMEMVFTTGMSLEKNKTPWIPTNC